MKKIKFLTTFLSIGVIIAFILYAYWDLPKTFFQQDEWQAFSVFIYEEIKGGIGNLLMLPILYGRGHFVPIIYLQAYLEFKFFGLSFEPYAYVAIATHIANSLLLFYLAYLLLKNKFLAFCSSLIFSVWSISNQAVTWIAASPITQGSILFMLLSLIFILKYFQNNKKKHYYLGLVFLLAGIFSKETVLFLFILYPLMWILFAKIKDRRHFYLFLKPIVILGLIYLLIRVSLFFLPSYINGRSSETVNLDVTSDIVRLVIAPFKILPQAIIPQQYLIDLSDKATLLFYPKHAIGGIVNPYYSQTVVFGQVIPFLSIPILLIGFIVYKSFLAKKNTNFAKAVIFSFLLITLSALPFAFIPGDTANLPIYESRHLHIAAMGIAIFLVIAAYSLVKFLVKQNKYIYIVMLIVLMPIFFMHLYLTRTEIDKVFKVSISRKYILNSIKKSYPGIPEKVVFYTESNRSYYGMPIEEKILPFQTNFGFMLAVWYQSTEKFPKCFYEEMFLRGILTQGYKDCGGRSFGYYRDYGKLIDAVEENKIPVNSIIAYSWNGETEELKDISEQIRMKIKEYEKNFKR